MFHRKAVTVFDADAADAECTGEAARVIVNPTPVKNCICPQLFPFHERTKPRTKPFPNTNTMPQKQRSRKSAATRKPDHDLAPRREKPQEGSESEVESDMESVKSLENDAEEEELNRLVFGDGAGFQQMLSQGMDVDSEGVGEAGKDEGSEAGGLAHVQDADV